MSDTRRGPGWRSDPASRRPPPGGQPKARPSDDRKRNDDRVSWITGGVIAAVFAISIIALAISRTAGPTATRSTPAPPPPTSVGGPRTTTPPAVVPTATAALPATGVVLWSGSGSGTGRGPQFTVPPGARGWDENWTFNCGALGRPGTFVTDIHGSGRDRGAHSEGMGGHGTDHYDDTGTFWVEVDSQCGWTDRAETAP